MMTRRASAGMAAVAFILGGIASQFVPPVLAQADAKAPTWRYGINARVRLADETSFNKETKKYGIEVFQDETTGNLIYISETGSIAVAPKR